MSEAASPGPRKSGEPTFLFLTSGEATLTRARRGDMLIVEEGAARIIDVPRWMGSGLEAGQWHLSPGEVFTVERTGYLTLQSIAPRGTRSLPPPTRLRVIQPQAPSWFTAVCLTVLALVRPWSQARQARTASAACRPGNIATTARRVPSAENAHG